MTAGWHGKLPTLGDFATRRLDPAVVQAWDDWLSHGLAALQRQPQWLDAYLASPSWRFLLMPGVLPGAAGSHAWVGVLMPSVDRVGRYFPLTLMQGLGALPASAGALDALWRWLVQLDEAAADALHDDWTLDALEDELQRLGPAPEPPTLPDGVDAVLNDRAVAALPLAAHGHAAALFAAQAAGTWQRQWQGRAFWYADAGLATPRLLASRGLEAHALLPRLLGGVTDNPA
jgi:type VI secretion system protein ImpM